MRLFAALLTLALALPSLASTDRDGPLVIAIDPGHGGAFPHDGAHGPKGLVEKNLSLQVAVRLKKFLEDAGATVVLTREDDLDISLAQRAQIANEAAADLFVSIHCNSMALSQDRKVTKGVETYFLAPDPTDAEAKLLAEMENGGPDSIPVPKTTDKVQGLLADLALGQARNDSAELAAKIHHQILRRTGAQSRGVRQAPFLVLWGVKMPAALVEIGFISHPQEAKMLAKDKYQQRMAEAIGAGIQDFADKVLARRIFPVTPEERQAHAAERQAKLDAWKMAAKRSADAKVSASRTPQDTRPAQLPPVPPMPIENGASAVPEAAGADPAIADPTVPDPTLPEPGPAEHALPQPGEAASVRPPSP